MRYWRRLRRDQKPAATNACGGQSGTRAPLRCRDHFTVRAPGACAAARGRPMTSVSAGDAPKHRTFDLDRSPVMLLDCPLPTSPIKGEVPLGACGAMEPHPPAGTLSFMGRVGEGTSTAQAQLAIMLPQGAGVEISDPRHSPFLD